MEQTALLQKSILVASVGIAAQWVAWRIRIPSIVLLALSGLLIGPILGWLDPAADFGPLVQVLIKLAVAVILFEGGLNLRFFELKEAGKAVRRLVFVTVPIAWLLGTIFAHWVEGLSIEVSLILAAILVVTGPTVIMPLIRQTRLSPRIASLLKWEGIINDPIGALLAVLVFEYFIFSGQGSPLTEIIFKTVLAIGVSLGLGLGMAFLLKLTFPRGYIPDYLKIPVVLCLVGVVYGGANLVQEEAGLLAVTVFGLALANIRLMIIDELRQFKEDITVFLVSAVFVLLAAGLQSIHLQSIGWRTIGFLAGILFVVRPISVYLATIGAGLTWQERALASWIAPRGIVAASVAGLFAPRLIQQGYEDAIFLVPLVFAVVFSTVLLHGFSLPFLAKKLGLSSTKPEGVMIVGASAWSTGLAWVLKQNHTPVLLVDSSWQRLKEARLQGIPIHYGEILSENTEEALDLSEMGYLLTATDNDAYNALVCNELGSRFERDRVFQVAMHKPTEHETKKVKSSSRGRIAFGADLRYETLLGRFFQGWRFQKTSITDAFSYDDYLAKREGEIEPIILVKEKGRLQFDTDDKPLSPKPGNVLISFSVPSR